MKNLTLLILVGALSVGTWHLLTASGTEIPTLQTGEIAMIRWDGHDNSFIVRPNGKVEKLGPLFERFPRPAGIDERIYFMTIAMNAIAKEGFEFAGAVDGHVVMKRLVRQ